ncbi:hypothetical protein GCM10010124_33600 [Pilimelia terevasa]|uniref:histidine kinase n=1 Tax=Pilimelia terevasa TaxID=53372 RepID=A0A8J3FL55_9ACTN|nr:HAMP domain-containing sensor histidine kinase [Pilimelia terevasa]GGK38066.1 hypothetical protein GCM10010124_33600 [Pilimelia terevasa]
MSQGALSWIVTVGAVLNVAIGAYALASYLRHRNPLHGWLAVVFLPDTLFLAVDLATRAGTAQPELLADIVLVGFAARPYLIVRMADRLRPVSRRADRLALAGVAGLSAAILAVPREHPPAVGFAYLVVTTALYTVATRLLAAEARHRTGSSAVRLGVAAVATAASGLVGVIAAAAAATGILTESGRNELVPHDALGEAFNLGFRLLGLAGALAYWLAFLPPRWLRRVWSARAAHVVGRRILEAPATESPAQVWQRYVDVVRTVVGADAAAVLLRESDGRYAYAARTAAGRAAGNAADLPAAVAAADLGRLRDLHQPVAVDPGRDAGSPLLRQWAGECGRCLLTVLPITGPDARTGVLLVLHRGRSLFTEDDMRLLADLGGHAAVLAERGAVLAARGAALSEQHRLARQLADTVNALRAAAEARDRFMSSMNHELRTPLNAIIGFSDLLRADVAGDPESESAQWLGHIHSSGTHLLRLINDLLDLAKVDSGQLDLQPAPLSVRSVVQQLVVGLRPLVAGKGLELRVEVADVVALLDPIRFRQIVENLLSNAIKFTPPDGRITLTVAAQERALVLTVADTGVGISPGDQDRIFEEFQQSGDATQRRAGTGLGLALVRRLVHAHGGEITLRSRPAHGSTFIVRLPEVVTADPAVRPDRHRMVS